MSRTKVKQNLIDASFGNILEQIFYRADGRTITTSQGNITVPNITSGTNISSSSYVDLPGTNISYQPPSGTTLVTCMVHFQSAVATSSGNTSSHQAPSFKFNVDGTDVTKSQRGFLTQSLWDTAYTNYLAMQITGGSDNLANEEMGTWTSAKVIKMRIQAYSASYAFKVNESYHFESAGTNTVVPPVIKITAYS